MQNTPGWNTPRPRHIIPSRKSRRAAADFLLLRASVLLQMQNIPGWHTLRPATHYLPPQTTGWAGGFEFVRNSWQEVESRSTLSIAGHPQGARCLPGCHRAACVSEASWPRMTAMEADAGEQDGRRVRWTAFPLRPASCVHQHSPSVQHPEHPVSSVLEKNKKRC